VVIKPNLCYYWDFSTGQTTDPRFVAALIELIREEMSSNVDISVVESDASAMRCKFAFRMLGYEKLADDFQVKLVNLSKDKGEVVDVRVGCRLFRLKVPRTIAEADLKINVPKIKYMQHTKISCALKNIFGCNPNPVKFRYHPILDETIVALNKIMRFNIHILDGLIASGVKPYKMNLIMASQDPVAFDAAAAKMAGVNPKKVKHIVLAAREGLGNIDYVPKGERSETFAKKFPRKGAVTKLLAFAYEMAVKTSIINAEIT